MQSCGKSCGREFPTSFKQCGNQDQCSVSRSCWCPDALVDCNASRHFICCKLCVKIHGKSSDEHWVAVKRIFRYLQDTKSHGICYQPSDKIDFRGYSDADWAGDLADRKSTSGYMFMLLEAPVIWGSKKQSSVSLRQNTLHLVWRFKKASGSTVCCVRS